MLMRALSVHVAHEIAGAARIRHSLRPLIGEGGEFSHNSGASRREISDAYPTVIVRLDRTTQYSRDASDRTEKPRRTGSPASAEDDSFVCGRTIHVIASEAKQSIAPHGIMDCFVASAPRNDGQRSAPLTPPPSPFSRTSASAPQTRTTCRPSP